MVRSHQWRVMNIRPPAYVLCEGWISDQAYHELAKDLLECMCFKELDTESQTWSTPGEGISDQQSLRVWLKRRLHVLMQNHPSILADPHIKVKLTGDGTRISIHPIVIVLLFFEPLHHLEIMSQQSLMIKKNMINLCDSLMIWLKKSRIWRGSWLIKLFLRFLCAD